MRDKIIYNFLLPVSVFVLALTFLRYMEPIWFPVIEGFRVISVKRGAESIVISGQTRKLRDCPLEYVRAIGLFDGERPQLALHLTYSEDDGITAPGKGNRQWGPWTITIPNYAGLQNVELHAAHSCHVAWDVPSHLATMPIDYSTVNDQNHPSLRNTAPYTWPEQ